MAVTTTSNADYVSYANTTDWDLSSGNFTVFGWNSVIDLLAGTNAGVIAKRTQGWGFITYNDSGDQRCWEYQSSTIRVNTADSGVIYVEDVWGNTALLADGTDVNSMFDAVELNDIAYDGTVRNGISPIELGKQSNDSGNMRSAEIAIWDDDLDSNNLNALNNGVCPFAIRNDILLFYAPIHRKGVDDQDYITQTQATINGTVNDSDQHPPVQLLQMYMP